MFPGFQMWVDAFLPVCANLDLHPEHWRSDGVASPKTHVAVSRQWPPEASADRSSLCCKAEIVCQKNST